MPWSELAQLLLTESQKNLLILIVVITAFYALICLFMFRVSLRKSKESEYNILDLSNRYSYVKFEAVFFKTISDFQNRLCGKSVLSLFARLIVLYVALLTITSTAFNPLEERVKDATQFAALAVWIVSNVICDFTSFQVTRSIYNFMSKTVVKNKSSPQFTSVANAIIRISFCSVFGMKFSDTGINTVLVKIGEFIGLLHAKLFNIKCYLRRQRAAFITIDMTITTSLFAINGYFTNYCYLILVDGGKWSFFKSIDRHELHVNPVEVILENIYVNCIVHMDDMINHYYDIITSPFDIFGTNLPGMAGITFITMATSIGPAGMFVVHKLNPHNDKHWAYPVYLAYIVALIPVTIISGGTSSILSADGLGGGLSSVEQIVNPFVLGPVIALGVIVFFPRLMVLLNTRYDKKQGCSVTR